LLAVYGSDRVRTSALGFDLGVLPDDLRTAVRLFSLGEDVGVHSAEALLSRDIVSAMAAVEILETRNGCVSLRGLRLVRHFGALILCELPAVSSRLYYGNDSLALGRLLLRACGRVLDFCAGVGTQAILCALTADSVIAVDREPFVAHVFAVNTFLNGVDDRVELRIGAAPTLLKGERFDLICCNPPLLPLPEDLPYPPTGHGGPDGLGVTRELLHALPQLLEPNGCCHTIGTLLGDDTGPALEPLADVAQGAELELLIILPGRCSLEIGEAMPEALARTVSRWSGLPVSEALVRLHTHFAERRARYLYSFLLSARRGTCGGAVRITRHYLRNDDFWLV
jgi:release factor glutamine methyltransferase